MGGRHGKKKVDKFCATNNFFHVSMFSTRPITALSKTFVRSESKRGRVQQSCKLYMCFVRPIFFRSLDSVDHRAKTLKIKNSFTCVCVHFSPMSSLPAPGTWKKKKKGSGILSSLPLLISVQAELNAQRTTTNKKEPKGRRKERVKGLIIRMEREPVFFLYLFMVGRLL